MDITKSIAIQYFRGGTRLIARDDKARKQLQLWFTRGHLTKPVEENGLLIAYVVDEKYLKISFPKSS